MSSLYPTALTLSHILREKNLSIATAESCTAGLLSSTLVDISGSSQWFERGFVTYSNEAKQTMLGVSNSLLQQHGAVSPECARAMVDGVLKNSLVDLAVSITGVAGPNGGSLEKAVGTVFIGIGLRGLPSEVYKILATGGRHAIRLASVEQALELCIRLGS